MQEVARFYKVSFDQFLQDSKKNNFTDNETSPEIVKMIWDKIKLPTRATKGSAGYDFYLPYPFFLKAGATLTIPTGIRVEINEGWFLGLIPRSSLGFKYGVRLLNTFGCVDSDYFFAENEGHIMAKITADTNMCLQDGDRFMQGLLLQHGITHEDNSDKERIGGFGSTGV